MVWDSNYSMWVDWARKTSVTAGTTGSATSTMTDGKDHPDYGIPLNYIPQNEGIIITSDAVFIKPLKLVVMTEDKYNELCKTRG